MESMQTMVPATAFALLAKPSGRWKSFGLSVLLQSLFVLVLANVGLMFLAPALRRVDLQGSVRLIAPESWRAPAAPRPIARLRNASPPAPEVTLRQETGVVTAPPPVSLPVPKADAPRTIQPSTPVPAVSPQKFSYAERSPKPGVPRTVATTNFGGSPAADTGGLARQVKTGGFGDSEGLQGNPTGKKSLLASIGSFDLPAGPGLGNGARGAKGVRAAGFGNEQLEGPMKGQGGLQSANFASGLATTSDPPKRPLPTAAAATESPVLLLSKPALAYTAEARQRKIEGDVELEVEFYASGKIRVLRVVHGLGYGLDEAAVSAAEQIRFTPARRDGQPVDSQGRLRMVFRLS